jgi:hypothetical protein
LRFKSFAADAIFEISPKAAVENKIFFCRRDVSLLKETRRTFKWKTFVFQKIRKCKKNLKHFFSSFRVPFGRQFDFFVGRWRCKKLADGWNGCSNTESMDGPTLLLLEKPHRGLARIASRRRND